MMVTGFISPPPAPLSSPSLHLTRPSSIIAAFFSAPIFSTQTLHLHHHLTPPKPLGRCGCVVYALKERNARGRGGGSGGGGNGKATVVEAEVVDEDDEEEFEFSEDEDDEEEFDFSEDDADEGEEFDFSDDDDDDDEEEEEEDDDELGDIDEESYGKMKSWLKKKKPMGFGEGKEYDTSLEDKLLEEMEQSRIAQIANINRLKLDASRTMPNKLEKAPEAIPSGIRLLISNLPKKKKIHRDLKSAFKDFPGIIGISPMVSGNKKTRDPVCKGFAHVHFKSLVDANRFIDLFSGQTVTFGKIGKKLRCELVKSSDSNGKGSSHNERKHTQSQVMSVVERQRRVYSNEDEPSLSLQRDGNQPLLSLQEDDDFEISLEIMDGDPTKDFETFTISQQDYRVESNMEFASDVSPSKNTEKKKEEGKKSKVTKKKTGKASILSITGAAKRLKTKEKAMLADVFSKYGKAIKSASEEER